MPIETKEEFEKWLDTQPREFCILIAARAALRVFPIITHGEHADKSLNLLTARAILTTRVAAKMPTPEVRAAARAAAYAADTAARGAHSSSAVVNAAHSAYSLHASTSAGQATLTVAFTDHAAYGVVSKNFDAADAAFPTASAAAAAVRAATYADTKYDFNALLSQPVWHEPGEPDWLQDALAGQDDLLDSGPEWAFWRDWYQGFRDGKPLDWALQYRVALIDNEIWKAGPEAVAREIEKIRKLYALEQEIATLKERLNGSAISEAPAHRLHNQPPEAIDDVAITVRKEITLVWEEIEALETEIAKPEPSASRLRKIAQALWDISLRIGKYCGEKLDIAVDAFAKAIGTGVAGAVIYLLIESINAVVKASWGFIKVLPPG